VVPEVKSIRNAQTFRDLTTPVVTKIGTRVP